MYHSDIKIQNGAFFITDAHYSSKHPALLDFLKAIQSKQLLPTQLIFMGDIFDALFGGVQRTSVLNEEAISIMNDLSTEIEIIYLEGNHDFNLKDIFPKCKVFKIAQQPLTCMYEDKKVILAHGDYDGVFSYKIYTALIRNRYVLKFLNMFDTYILNFLDQHLGNKDDCKELPWFDGFIRRRIENKYDCDYFVEGHFHQNKIINFDNSIYINLGAFACNQRYFIVESSKDKKFLRESSFSQGDINNG